MLVEKTVTLLSFQLKKIKFPLVIIRGILVKNGSYLQIVQHSMKHVRF